MENLIKASRIFYAIGLIGLGIQQFVYSEFRPVIMPEWPKPIPGIAILAYITGALLVVAGVIIISSKNARTVSIITGLCFLIFFIAFQVVHQLFYSPFPFQLGFWTNPLKELAFSGGAFILAASYPNSKFNTKNEILKMPGNKLIMLGTIFFSITMIAFGIDHFLYTGFVVTLVPSWIPFPLFWTYFAAVALIGGGVAFIIRFQLKTIGLLFGAMLFIWFLILHIPRAVADPYTDKGNELTSVFEALAFSGIAFLIACMPYGKQVENLYQTH